MIKQLLQHLDALQVDLAAIDPNPEFDVADRVAAIAFALQRAVAAAEITPVVVPQTAVAQRAGA